MVPILGRMARPPHTPRLSEIDATEVARRAVQLAAQRAGLQCPQDPEQSTLGAAAARVARYARGDADAPPHDQIPELLFDLARGLYCQDPADVPTDLRSITGVCFFAARGRHKMSAKPPVALTTSEVAALLGRDPSNVRRLGREGALKRWPEGSGLWSPESVQGFLESSDRTIDEFDVKAIAEEASS